MMNELYADTPQGATCEPSMIAPALDAILTANSFTYESILFQLPARQKDVLFAICKAGKAQQPTSSRFLTTYHLPSASSVQSALRGLIDKEFVTDDFGTYEVYDKFFALWLNKRL